MRNVEQLAIDLTEQGVIPDLIIRGGIRRLLKQRLKEVRSVNKEDIEEYINEFVAAMSGQPIALVPEIANQQHYELPSEFFQTVLGPHLKYSCGYWPDGVATLDHAERAALAETCHHARLSDGQRILELGCGWGALSFWAATHYRNSQITVISNSNSQREFIQQRAMTRGLKNLKVITCDINCFETDGEQFDRVISVEMFEHLRNWPRVYSHIASWLKPGGLFFKHIFVHRSAPYLFENLGPGDWMSRHFFSGGMMPSENLPMAFQQEMALKQRWRWNGRHYEATANAWLQRMDNNAELLWPLFESTYGADNTRIWWNRWRVFFMACAELFAFKGGEEWYVCHYLFEKANEKQGAGLYAQSH